jgi:peptide/nickel transport system permease protein
MSPERHGRRGAGAALAFLLALAAAGLAAPILATDRPLLARRGGVLVFPALADLPLLRGLAPTRAASQPDPVPLEPLLRSPIPYSFRGIRLDETLRPPDRRHLLGTDALGRDLLARILHGIRPALLVGFAASAAGLLAGIALGAAAALRRGLLDLAIMRLVDTLACFPAFVLALAWVAASGRGGLPPLIAGIALSRVAGAARYVRGEILKQRGSELWASARASGCTGPRLLARHLLPILLPALAVIGAFGVAHAVVLEASLGFIGFGVDPPAPSWGSLLAESRHTLGVAWWPVLFPSLGLFLTLLSLCVLGERIAGWGREPQRPAGWE